MIPFGRLGYAEATRLLFERANDELGREGKNCVPARVISLDRGYPLVSSFDFEGRAEPSTAIKKSDEGIIAIGDWVALWCPRDHERAVIERVLPRRNEIARVKRIGRGRQLRRQVLAANVDIVCICQSLTGAGVDMHLLVRQMVAVAGCDAEPVFVLTKGDLVDENLISRTREMIRDMAPDVPLFVVSIKDRQSIDDLRRMISPEATVLLLGESGVGKSSLANALLGESLFETGMVRGSDDKGRHTTVARRLIPIPGGGLIIDAPGLRTLQILDKPVSLKAAFPDIAREALGCKFRDCTHTDEPGCVVRQSVPEKRLEAYRYIASSAL